MRTGQLSSSTLHAIQEVSVARPKRDIDIRWLRRVFDFLPSADTLLLSNCIFSCPDRSVYDVNDEDADLGEPLRPYPVQFLRLDDMSFHWHELRALLSLFPPQILCLENRLMLHPQDDDHAHTVAWEIPESSISPTKLRVSSVKGRIYPGLSSALKVTSIRQSLKYIYLRDIDDSETSEIKNFMEDMPTNVHLLRLGLERCSSTQGVY